VRYHLDSVSSSARSPCRILQARPLLGAEVLAVTSSCLSCRSVVANRAGSGFGSMGEERGGAEGAGPTGCRPAGPWLVGAAEVVDDAEQNLAIPGGHPGRLRMIARMFACPLLPISSWYRSFAERTKKSLSSCSAMDPFISWPAGCGLGEHRPGTRRLYPAGKETDRRSGSSLWTSVQVGVSLPQPRHRNRSSSTRQ